MASKVPHDPTLPYPTPINFDFNIPRLYLPHGYCPNCSLFLEFPWMFCSPKLMRITPSTAFPLCSNHLLHTAHSEHLGNATTPPHAPQQHNASPFLFFFFFLSWCLSFALRYVPWAADAGTERSKQDIHQGALVTVTNPGESEGRKAGWGRERRRSWTVMLP